MDQDLAREGDDVAAALHGDVQLDLTTLLLLHGPLAFALAQSAKSLSGKHAATLCKGNPLAGGRAGARKAWRRKKAMGLPHCGIAGALLISHPQEQR
jgi:hypothetical protein